MRGGLRFHGVLRFRVWCQHLADAQLSALPLGSDEEAEVETMVTAGSLGAALMRSMSSNAPEALSLMHCDPCRLRSKRTACLNHSETVISCSLESIHWKARRSLISSGKAMLPDSNFANVVSYIHSMANLPKRTCDLALLPPADTTFAVHQFSAAFNARLWKELNLPMCFESGETPLPKSGGVPMMVLSSLVNVAGNASHCRVALSRWIWLTTLSVVTLASQAKVVGKKQMTLSSSCAVSKSSA